jgi:hypothetical protein
MVLLEDKIRDHPDREELTVKLMEVLFEASAAAGTDPTGACHFGDGSCQELTELDCINQKGIKWDGPGTHCYVTTKAGLKEELTKSVV